MSPGAPPMTIVVQMRRYRCLQCKAVIVVGPAGLIPGRLYSGLAIVWAFAMFGLARHSAAAVRCAVSPWREVGATAAATWATLRRWLTAVRHRRLLALAVRRFPDDWTSRQVAERAAASLAAVAPAAHRDAPLTHQAWYGAVHLGRAIAM